MVLAFAALPALGNFAGGALAEFVPVSRLALNLAPYGAAGVVVAVVAVELMPRALEAEPAWAIVLAFMLGGVCSTRSWTGPYSASTTVMATREGRGRG